MKKMNAECIGDKNERVYKLEGGAKKRPAMFQTLASASTGSADFLHPNPSGASGSPDICFCNVGPISWLIKQYNPH